MYAKRIIPCLDVKEGRVVKGVNFVNLIDAGDPVECAKVYDKAGADELVFLDKSGWDVYLNGGRVNTGIDALEWAKKAEELGAGEILLTSMDCDGTKAGYDIELTRRVSENAKIPVIASGGAGKMEHFLDAFTEGKADAVLAASLFHFREIEINDLKKYLRENGESVRL